MSGGSYDYLCWKDLDDIIDIPYQLPNMAEDLMAEWPESKAAHDTRHLLELLVTFKELIGPRLKALQEVWKAQEWCQSGDYGKDQVTAAIYNYEKGKDENNSQTQH